MPQEERAPKEHEFEEELTYTDAGQEHLQWRDIRRVGLPVSADLGTCVLSVRDILSLQRGNILTLNKLAGEMADIRINELLLGKGEVVVMGDTLHVRIAEVSGAAELESMQYD